MTVLLFLCILWLSLQNIGTLINLRHWPSVEHAKQNCDRSEPKPLLSLLIPARNEESRIGSSLDSALAQQYEPLEIIVLNDQSEDRTATLLAKRAGSDTRLQILLGDPLPAGWYGKAHACQQLADHATGDWFLFVDADVTLTPDASDRLLASALHRQCDVVSGFPRVTNSHLTAWLATSMMTFTIAAHLPVRLVELSTDPRFVAGSGMVMLLSRTAYERIGGHARSAQHIVDDMALLRASKRAGLRVSLLDITDCSSVQMYESADEVWAGFSKNLYAGIGRSPLLLTLIIGMYTLWYIAPLFALLYALLGSISSHFANPGVLYQIPLSLVTILLGIILKWQIDARFRVPFRYSLLAALSAALLIGIAVRSAWQDISGRGQLWKGRRYP